MKAAILFVFILFFSSMPMSYAVSGDSGAGIMPGSFLYSFDLFFERVELFFAFTAEKKVQVLTSVAEERSLELEALDDAAKDKYSSTLASQRDLYTEMASNLIDDSSAVVPDDSSVIDDDDSSVIDDDSDDSSAVSDEVPTDIEDDTDPAVNTSLQAEPEDSDISDPKLSVFQETACLAADEGNTCNTRLSELGLVTKEQCCTSLGVCCS